MTAERWPVDNQTKVLHNYGNGFRRFTDLSVAEFPTHIHVEGRYRSGTFAFAVALTAADAVRLHAALGVILQRRNS